MITAVIQSTNAESDILRSFFQENVIVTNPLIWQVMTRIVQHHVCEVLKYCSDNQNQLKMLYGLCIYAPALVTASVQELFQTQAESILCRLNDIVMQWYTPLLLT
jgi:hypothetical protein